MAISHPSMYGRKSLPRSMVKDGGRSAFGSRRCGGAVPAAGSGRGIPGGGEEVRYLLVLLLSSSEWEKEPESELLSGGLPPRLVRRLLRDGLVPDRWVRLRGSGVDSATDLHERLLRFGGGEASCGSLLSLSKLEGLCPSALGFAGGE